jgi:hypothetical protein
VKEQRGPANASEYTTKSKNETFHSFGDRRFTTGMGWMGREETERRIAEGAEKSGQKVKKDLSGGKKGGLGECPPEKCQGCVTGAQRAAPP